MTLYLRNFSYVEFLMLDEFDEDEVTVVVATDDPKLQKPKIYIKARKFLYLLFYVAEDHKGKNMIAEAAQTRLRNIKNQSWYNDKTNKAFSMPIQSIDEVLYQIPLIIEKHSENKTNKVIIQEMGFFSHSGWDGPISYETPIKICPIIPLNTDYYPVQMDMCGWEQINVKWAKDAKCVFYGCNTGNPYDSENMRIPGISFAENISNLSNFKNVEVWGQTNYSYPSFYPDYRVTGLERIIDNKDLWDLGEHTYMVAGNESNGEIEQLYNLWRVAKAGIGREQLTSEQLGHEGYPKALPMNCYKNGKFIKYSHQGIFNDHR